MDRFYECYAWHDSHVKSSYKVLSKLGIFQSIKGLLKKIHANFSHSPRRHFEFVKLVDVMETKGLKLLIHVQTYWMLLLEPLRRLLAQYRVILAKMVEDYDDKKEAHVIFLVFIFYIFTLTLALDCLLIMWWMRIGLILYPWYASSHATARYH